MSNCINHTRKVKTMSQNIFHVLYTITFHEYAKPLKRSDLQEGQYIILADSYGRQVARVITIDPLLIEFARHYDTGSHAKLLAPWMTGGRILFRSPICFPCPTAILEHFHWETQELWKSAHRIHLTLSDA
jgi:hypothetical protein